MNIAATPSRDSKVEPFTSGPSLKVWSIITSLTTGGAEMLVTSLNACFAKNGVQHTVIALCDATKVGNSSETEQRLADQIEAAGGRFVTLRLGRWRDPISGSRALNRLLALGAPDLIHAHTARAVPMISGSRFNGAVVLTHHNSRLSFPKLFFRHLDRVVDHYVAISAETEAIYSAQCRKPARRISNGVSGAFFSGGPRAAAKQPAVLISVGAISDQKNYGLLLATAQELQSCGGDKPIATFKIAGAGDDLVEYRDRVKQMGLRGVVDFLGERSDVPGLLADADVFLNTSNYEGQSVAMLEAMAMALPVVATDVPGNRDLVTHGKNGVLVDHNAPRQLADAITRLIENPAYYSDLSRGARQAGQEFSVETTAAAHLELYRSLASKGVSVSQKG